MKKGLIGKGVLALSLVCLAGCGGQNTGDSESSGATEEIVSVSSSQRVASSTGASSSGASSSAESTTASSSKTAASTTLAPPTTESSTSDTTTMTSEDLRGDLEAYHSVTDEIHQLTLFYPNVFVAEGTVDSEGIRHFTSQQDSEELLFWITENTYSETPAELKDRMALTEGVTLEANAVAGYGEALDQESGERNWSAYYWVVNPEFVANVEIRCSNETEAQNWYRQLQDNAVYLEATGGD